MNKVRSMTMKEIRDALERAKKGEEVIVYYMPSDVSGHPAKARILPNTQIVPAERYPYLKKRHQFTEILVINYGPEQIRLKHTGIWFDESGYDGIFDNYWYAWAFIIQRGNANGTNED